MKWSRLHAIACSGLVLCLAWGASTTPALAQADACADVLAQHLATRLEVTDTRTFYRRLETYLRQDLYKALDRKTDNSFGLNFLEYVKLEGESEEETYLRVRSSMERRALGVESAAWHAELLSTRSEEQVAAWRECMSSQPLRVTASRLADGNVIVSCVYSAKALMPGSVRLLGVTHSADLDFTAVGRLGDVASQFPLEVHNGQRESFVFFDGDPHQGDYVVVHIDRLGGFLVEVDPVGYDLAVIYFKLGNGAAFGFKPPLDVNQTITDWSVEVIEGDGTPLQKNVASDSRVNVAAASALTAENLAPMRLAIGDPRSLQYPLRVKLTVGTKRETIPGARADLELTIANEGALLTLFDSVTRNYPLRPSAPGNGSAPTLGVSVTQAIIEVPAIPRQSWVETERQPAPGEGTEDARPGG